MSKTRYPTSNDNERSDKPRRPAKTVAGHPERVDPKHKPAGAKRRPAEREGDDDAQADRPELAPGGGSEPRDEDDR
jgi:hypothetical protein